MVSASEIQLDQFGLIVEDANHRTKSFKSRWLYIQFAEMVLFGLVWKGISAFQVSYEIVQLDINSWLVNNV